MERIIESNIVDLEEYTQIRNLEVSSYNTDRLSNNSLKGTSYNERKAYSGPKDLLPGEKEKVPKSTGIIQPNYMTTPAQPTPQMNNTFNRAAFMQDKPKENRSKKFAPTDDPWGEYLQNASEKAKEGNLVKEIPASIKRVPNVINYSKPEKPQRSLNSSSLNAEEEKKFMQNQQAKTPQTKTFEQKNDRRGKNGKDNMWDQVLGSSEGYIRNIKTWSEIFPYLTPNFISSFIKENPTLSDNEMFERLSAENERAESQTTAPATKLITNAKVDQVKITNPNTHINKPSFSLNLGSFKINPCSQGKNCTFTLCQNYHFLGERRRDPRTYKYDTILCKNIAKGRCPQNDQCRHSHTLNEIYYHDKVFKTSPCVFIENCQDCPFEILCFYYHNAQERRNTSAVESVIEEVKFLAEKINKLQVEFTERNSSLTAIQQKILDMKRATACMKCMINERKLYMQPCGHSLCDVCQSIQNAICGKCGVQISSITFIKLYK